MIEKANSYFSEQYMESSRPGDFLAQDTFYLGRLKGIGKIYLQAVVDTYSSFGFGFLHTGAMKVSHKP